MKKQFTLLGALAVLLLVGCQDIPTAFDDLAHPEYQHAVRSGAGTVDLNETSIHNNGNAVGNVSISNRGNVLSVAVTLSSEGYFLKSYGHVGADLEDIPHTPSGKPIPGQFQKKEYFGDHPSSFTLTFELDDDDIYVDDDEERWVYVAVYAEAIVGGKSQGLWIGDVEEGPRFHENKNGNGNWATYFLYNLQEGEEEDLCETVERWAEFGGTEAESAGGNGQTHHYYLTGTANGAGYEFEETLLELDDDEIGTLTFTDDSIIVTSTSDWKISKVWYNNTGSADVNDFGNGYEKANDLEADFSQTISGLTFDERYLFLRIGLQKDCDVEE